MNDRKDIRTKLNLTQEDMAMLLKITRSRWSLYEIGLRDLPTATIVKLGELSLLLETPISKKAKKLPQLEVHEQKKLKMYNSQLSEVVFKLKDTARKMEKMEKEYAQSLELLQLLSEVPDFISIFKSFDSTYLQIARGNAVKSLDKNGEHHLAKLQFKHQVMLQEELILKALLKKNKKT